MGRPELPADGLPVVERDCVRVVVRDAAGLVLLFRTQDPTYPELGTWWELPGGGLEEGESHADAAARELLEETGIRVDPARVGAPTWRRDATYRYRGERRLQHERVLEARLTVPGPAVDGSGRVGYEDEDYVDYRWWPVEEIIDSRERFYPGRLPALLPAFLAGERIDEPFELWS